MNNHSSILLAAGLSLAACAGPSSVRSSTSEAALPGDQLTVQVVEASGGA